MKNVNKPKIFFGGGGGFLVWYMLLKKISLIISSISFYLFKTKFIVLFQQGGGSWLKSKRVGIS